MTLTDARTFLGWTLAKLAQEADASVSVIHDLENGRNGNPGYALVMRIVKALQRGGLPGVSPEDIFPVETPNSDRVA